MIKKQLTGCLNSFTFPKRISVAYSGGVDSHVLLHALVELKKEFADLEISAIHINHQLQKSANDWEKHCQKTCDDLSVPIQIIKVDANKTAGESPEAAARQARYECFAKALKEKEYLLTAHHQDDQAETLLLQLLRGAGVKGLSAMPKIMPFAEGFLARPLLDINKETILVYAKQHQLSWIEDASNQDVNFQRNFLRHQVMPLLKTIRPAAISAISRSAQHCATASDLLEEFAQEDLVKVKIDEKSLSAKALQQLSSSRQINVMRYWLQLQGCILPSTVKMQHILQDLIASRYDAKPEITWAGVKLVRVKDVVLLSSPRRRGSTVLKVNPLKLNSCVLPG